MVWMCQAGPAHIQQTIEDMEVLAIEEQHHSNFCPSHYWAVIVIYLFAAKGEVVVSWVFLAWPFEQNWSGTLCITRIDMLGFVVDILV